MVSFSKFITSQRGGQILVDTDGYLYSLKNQQKTGNTYICRRQRRKKTSGVTDCPPKLFWYSQSKLHLETVHNHEPTPGEAEALETKTVIKRKASEQPLTPTQNIITEALSQSTESDHLLPKWQSLQQIVKRARHCTDSSPSQLKSHRADYIIPEDHEIDDSGKRKKKRIDESIFRDHLRNFANLEISDYMYKLVTIIGYTVNA